MSCNCKILRDRPAQPYLVHVGWRTEQYQRAVSKLAADLGLEYRLLLVKDDIFRAGGLLKTAAFAVIWNGAQHYSPLARRICECRGIPYLLYEWGVLPQKDTFLLDPAGYCGDSILCGDLSWVTDRDMENLVRVRTGLGYQYPRRPVAKRMLVVLQIENDSQILYHTPYNSMKDFVADIESAYPDYNIVVRPHPKTGGLPAPARARVEGGGDFLAAAAGAERVAGLTSTALYEAALLGVPVSAFGSHPLAVHPPERHDRVLAGLLALRVPREGGDWRAVAERFNLRPRRTGEAA